MEFGKGHDYLLNTGMLCCVVLVMCHGHDHVVVVVVVGIVRGTGGVGGRSGCKRWMNGRSWYYTFHGSSFLRTSRAFIAARR